MKILPGRTALKTLELMSSSLLGITILYCSTSNSTVEMFRMFGDMQETAGFDL